MTTATIEPRDILNRYLVAFCTGSPDDIEWTPSARLTESNVQLAPGDGSWHTVSEVDRLDLWVSSDHEAAVFGILREGDVWSRFCQRIRIDGRGRIDEAELVVIRARDASGVFHDADVAPRPEFDLPVPAESRTERAELLALTDGYFDTLEQNTGDLHTRFTPDCRRRENGVWTTQSSDPNAFPTMKLDCADSFELGFFRANERVRARRSLIVDEERGLVLAAAFIDHSGRVKEYTLTNGEVMHNRSARPDSLCMFELFKIVDGRISAIEAVFQPVPYGMPSPWIEEELRAPGDQHLVR